MPLLEATDYKAVRAAVDLSLTEAQVPDDVIALPVFQGRGERDVLLRDPLASTYEEEGPTEDEWAASRRAAIFLTGAYLAIRLPQITQERAANQASVTYKAMDMAAVAADLRAAAEQEFASYLDEEDTIPLLLPGFTLLGGGRDG